MYILLRRHTPVVVLEEDGLSDPLASILNCAVATAAAALRMSGDLRGRSVLITGAGMLGLVACAMARAQGASLVHATDIAPDRQVRALAFGAHRSWVAEGDWASVLADELDGPHPFDCVFDFTGDPVVIGAGVGLLSIGGTAVWVGSTYPQPSVSISAEQIVRRVLTIRGIHNYNADDLLRAVEFMESFHDKYPFQSLVEGEFSLSEAADAFHFALSRHPYRAGIRF
jgi:threonine dehydrogenase-like Zn-dependent dehydrogenase